MLEKPWSESCDAVVASEDESGALVPTNLHTNGFSYFLEVDIAKQFLQDWLAPTPRAPTDGESCARLIQYAVNDA